MKNLEKLNRLHKESSRKKCCDNNPEDVIYVYQFPDSFARNDIIRLAKSYYDLALISEDKMKNANPYMNVVFKGTKKSLEKFANDFDYELDINCIIPFKDFGFYYLIESHTLEAYNDLEEDFVLLYIKDESGELKLVEFDTDIEAKSFIEDVKNDYYPFVVEIWSSVTNMGPYGLIYKKQSEEEILKEGILISSIRDKVKKWVEDLNEMHKDDSPLWRYVFDYTEGAKYFKVFYHSGVDDDSKPLGSTYVFAFVDKEGNIYKPDGWRTPAKGVRGTLDNPPMTSRDLYRRK